MKELPANLPQNWVEQHTQTILSSYKKWTGKHLLEQPLQLPVLGWLTTQLFYAPFVLVTSNAKADPILNYGKKQALDLWEMPWETLIQTEGRKTAEAMHRDERQKFLDTVKKNGFIDNYSGVRISSSGKRFRIEQATVWNLIDAKGSYAGQAAAFRKWTFL